MQTDQQLLEEFARSGSEDAFRKLVERHLDLVHSVARRVTCNDDLARDVAQAVFLKLATRPDSVPKGLRLLAWLHRTTRHKAIDLVRSENRRRRREEIASQQQRIEMDTPESDWKELEPVIDEALAKLPDTDRSLILSRFYQRRSHAAAARDLGISEDAARMRTSRALDKLRRVLKKRGVTTTAALLGTAVSANAVTTAPAALAASISSSTLVAASSAAGTATGLAPTLIAMTKTHLAAAAAVAIGVPIIALQFAQNTRLKREVGQLETRLANTTVDPAVTLSGLASTRADDIAKGASGNDLSGAKGEPAAFAPGTSLDEILAHRDPLTRLRALLGYVDQLSDEEIPAALAKLRQSTPEWDADAKVAAQLLLTRWGKADPNAAFEYIEASDYKRGGGDATVILSALAAMDPQRAVAWLENPDNKLAHLPWMGGILAGTIAKEWVRQDPDAALAWASSTPDKQREGALTGVLGSIAATDPQRASTLALELEPGKTRTDALAMIAQAWAQREPQEALNWANSLDAHDRERTVNESLQGWAQTAPADAAAYLETMAADAREHMLTDVASSWARQAPAQAAEWLAAQPESDGKADAMGHVMWNWTVANPEAASTWLLDQPPGDSRDNAIGALAKAAFDEDPGAAVAWAATISDERRRAVTLEHGVRAWLEQKPAEAREWITTTDAIAPQEAQRFLTPREGAGRQ